MARAHNRQVSGRFPERPQPEGRKNGFSLAGRAWRAPKTAQLSPDAPKTIKKGRRAPALRMKGVSGQEGNGATPIRRTPAGKSPARIEPKASCHGSAGRWHAGPDTSEPWSDRGSGR